MTEEKAAQEMSVEEALRKLDGILADMDREDQTLEGSFQSYQQGLELIRFCSAKIEGIEKQLQILENGPEENHE